MGRKLSVELATIIEMKPRTKLDTGSSLNDLASPSTRLFYQASAMIKAATWNATSFTIVAVVTASGPPCAPAAITCAAS